MSRSASKPERRNATNVAACTCANLRKAARVVTQRYDAALQPTGLKTTQFTLLATLTKRGDLPLTHLAEALVMDRTTLTRNLKPLVGKGFIRIENEQDQRVRKIKLTEKGSGAFKNALPHWAAVQSQIVAGLGLKRWSGFVDDLAAIVDEARRN
ncbi:MAG: MarR family winged helix-turn-helix transcriptional regulator [Hyphomicrobium sp.]